MAAINFRAGALQLHKAVQTIAAGPLDGRAAAKVALQLEFGATQVRSLGNPFFERMSAELLKQAEAVKGGTAQSLKVIQAANEGATWLFARSAPPRTFV